MTNELVQHVAVNESTSIEWVKTKTVTVFILKIDDSAVPYFYRTEPHNQLWGLYRIFTVFQTFMQETMFRFSLKSP